MISLIVAMDKNRVIGRDEGLPWDYREDLKHFKKVTGTHDIFMGRTTFDSIRRMNNGSPLPNRKHIVASHMYLDSRNQHILNKQGVEFISDIDEYFSELPEDKDLFIIGGASIYKQTLKYVDKMYITVIDREFEGDTYFPEFDQSEWELVSYRHGENEDLVFMEFDRIKIGLGKFNRAWSDTGDFSGLLVQRTFGHMMGVVNLFSTFDYTLHKSDNPATPWYPISHELRESLYQIYNKPLIEFNHVQYDEGYYNNKELGNGNTIEQLMELTVNIMNENLRWSVINIYLHIIKIVREHRQRVERILEAHRAAFLINRCTSKSVTSEMVENSLNGESIGMQMREVAVDFAKEIDAEAAKVMLNRMYGKSIGRSKS